VPTTQRDTDLQAPMLSAVRESQAALVDLIRSWSDITEQLTRRLPLPVAGIDVAGAVDRAFDLAEQTLAAQHQLALTLVGAVGRQVESAVEAVEASAHETLREIEHLSGEAEAEQPSVAKAEAPADELRKQEAKRATKPDRRPFQERSVEELRDRARELEIEGRASMSKDELIAALRQRAK
jgi:Rho termination factor, N-terminal domain